MDDPNLCYPVYGKEFFVGDYYKVEGMEQMKAEIAANGPISCSMHITEKFERYIGGIFEEEIDFKLLNHDVAVVGWGSDRGHDYWIGRNSWGTYWGDHGFFKITTNDAKNLGLTRRCYAGTATYDKPSGRPRE